MRMLVTQPAEQEAPESSDRVREQMARSLEIYERIQAGDTQARWELVLLVDPLIHWWAGRSAPVRHGHVSLEDAVGTARMLVYRASGYWDPEKGRTWKNFAPLMLRGLTAELRRENAEATVTKRDWRMATGQLTIDVDDCNLSADSHDVLRDKVEDALRAIEHATRDDRDRLVVRRWLDEEDGGMVELARELGTSRQNVSLILHGVLDRARKWIERNDRKVFTGGK